jgi:hypothetical protein
MHTLSDNELKHFVRQAELTIPNFRLLVRGLDALAELRVRAEEEALKDDFFEGDRQ